MPSMLEAAQIRDVVKRHAYVFDNGLCSPDFFDVEKRRHSEEFRLLEGIPLDCRILEIGCFTGLNLLSLWPHYRHLTGIDFVPGAVAWLCDQAKLRGMQIETIVGDERMCFGRTWDRIILFDVLEHQLNIGCFLSRVSRLVEAGGQALFLVPAGREFYDCGHVAFFPDEECLTNVLNYYFTVLETQRLECGKIFARCAPR